jgi:hypothetical protein
MTAIPLLAFTANDNKLDLDIAAEFLVAGALPSSDIKANASNTPPIISQSVARGVAAALLPYFKYDSKATAAGDWHSKFEVVIPTNPRLEVMLTDPLKAITNLTGTVNIPFLLADGVNRAPVAGVASLETLIYFLADENADVQMSKVNIAGSVYHRIVADYTFARTTSGGGGGGGQ